MKKQYVDYLFNNTSLIIYFTGEQNSIFMQQGEEIGLFTSSDVCNIGRRRALYTSQETKVQFWPLAAYHIFHNRYIKSPFCFCKRGGIEVKALEKKNIYNKIFKCDTIVALLAAVDRTGRKTRCNSFLQWVMRKCAHAHLELIQNVQFRARVARKECDHFHEDGRNSIFRYKRPKRAVGALHFYTSSERIVRVASCIFLTNSCEPELAHRLQTSKMRCNSTSLDSCQYGDIIIVTVSVARRRWTAPLKPRRPCVNHFTTFHALLKQVSPKSDYFTPKGHFLRPRAIILRTSARRGHFRCL